MPEFMALHGADLISNGYEIVPLRLAPADPKAPLGTARIGDWAKIRSNHKILAGWIGEGFGKCGVGLPTKTTPAVDLDIYDASMCRDMAAFVTDLAGWGLERVGQPPKLLILYRSETPFAKVSSSIWVDDGKNEHKVEILGDGQQCVAFAIHPKTDKPFEWLHADGPLVTPRAELPELTVEHAREIAAEFDRRAAAAGWTLKRAANAPPTRANVDRDDPFMADSRPIDITDEELRSRTLLIPNDDADYDRYLEIGAALHHQTGGGELGEEIFRAWASQSGKYEEADLQKRWRSYGKDNPNRAPVTARTILKLSKEYLDVELKKARAAAEAALLACASTDQLRAEATKIKHIAFDDFDRSEVVRVLRDKYKELTKSAMPVGVARDLVRFEDAARKQLPKWLEGWVYVRNEARFFNPRHDKFPISREAFDAVHARFMITPEERLEGKAKAEMLPSELALGIAQIPHAHGTLYEPGEGLIFRRDGIDFANVYTEAGIPAVPEKYSKRDVQNIRRVRDHFAHLIEDERERDIVKSWMAHVVREPKVRINYAILIQGTRGDGKSFLFFLLRALIGADNAFVIDNKMLTSEFNAWSTNSRLGFIEELRVASGRYDLLDRIKPLITNDVIPLRKMRTDALNVRNHVNYMGATNYRNALPIDDNENRYFIVFSRWQDEASLKAWTADRPAYYAELYRAIEESPGALRRWLTELPAHAEFSPRNRAPESKAARLMANYEHADMGHAIRDALAEGGLGCEPELVIVSALREKLAEMGVQNIPIGRAWSNMMHDAGLSPLGQIQVNGELGRESVWTAQPNDFTDKSGRTYNLRVRRAYEKFRACEDL